MAQLVRSATAERQSAATKQLDQGRQALVEATNKAGAGTRCSGPRVERKDGSLAS